MEKEFQQKDSFEVATKDGEKELVEAEIPNVSKIQWSYHTKRIGLALRLYYGK